MPPPRTKSKISDYSVQSSGTLIVQRESTDEFYLRYKFGERLKVLEIGISRVTSLEKQKIIDGSQCVLIATKFEKNDQQSQQCNYSVCNKLSGPHIKGFYLAGPGSYNPKRAQEELNTIANFSELALDPGKLASRLELLVSPAKRGGPKNSPYQFDLPLTMFEVIDAHPENQTMGCGFIAPEVLKSLLGNTSCAQNATAIQGKDVNYF